MSNTKIMSLSFSQQRAFFSQSIGRDQELPVAEQSKASRVPLETDFRLGKCIGSGAQGKVYEAFPKVNDGRFPAKVAVKTVHLKARSREDLWLLEREISVMRALSRNDGSSNGLVDFFAVYRSRRNINIVLEFCGHGSLFEYTNESARLPEPQCRVIASQLLVAVAFLHSLGFVHRDIKLENILLVNLKPLCLRLGDFGLTCSVSEAEEFSGDVVVGTTAYMAPEILLREPHGRPVDVWAVGVVIFELLSGDLPFESRSERKQEQHIVNFALQFDWSKWQTVSQEAQDFVMRSLLYEPRNRITVGQAAEHQWLLADPTCSGPLIEAVKVKRKPLKLKKPDQNKRKPIKKPAKQRRNNAIQPQQEHEPVANTSIDSVEADQQQGSDTGVSLHNVDRTSVEGDESDAGPPDVDSLLRWHREGKRALVQSKLKQCNRKTVLQFRKAVEGKPASVKKKPPKKRNVAGAKSANSSSKDLPVTSASLVGSGVDEKKDKQKLEQKVQHLESLLERSTV